MKKFNLKILVTALILFTCVAVIQLTKVLIPSKTGASVSSSGRTKGNPKADIHIIEYVDFRCGPCAHGTLWLKDIVKKHADRIYIEVRYFPLNLSLGALDARFAECASRQGKFWDVFEALMGRQAQWIRFPNPETYYLEMAQEMGLDIDRLKACWSDPAVYDEIIMIKDSGKQLGVSATPTYFINDKMVVGAGNLKSELGQLLGLNENKDVMSP